MTPTKPLKPCLPGHNPIANLLLQNRTSVEVLPASHVWQAPDCLVSPSRKDHEAESISDLQEKIRTLIRKEDYERLLVTYRLYSKSITATLLDEKQATKFQERYFEGPPLI